MSDNSQSWTCVCGNTNSGNFCINCGKNRAEGEVKKPDSDVSSAGAASVAAAVAATTVAPTTPQQVPQPQMQQPVQPQVQQPYMNQQPVQPQYVSQPVQPMQPQYQQYQPITSAQSEDEEFARNKRISNRFSLISLILHYGSPTVFGIVSAIGNSIESSAAETLTSILACTIGLGVTASYVLMIIARVKCRKATFGKVLMWVYIIELILEILAVVLLVVFFINLFRECNF